MNLFKDIVSGTSYNMLFYCFRQQNYVRMNGNIMRSAKLISSKKYYVPFNFIKNTNTYINEYGVQKINGNILVGLPLKYRTFSDPLLYRL